MSTPAVTPRPRREPLTPARVVAAALELVDAGGLEALSMRKLGRRLGVEAMALYNHVPDREGLLDLLADAVMAEVTLPDPRLGWRAAIRGCAVSLHEALGRHPWAGSVLESRVTPGPARLAYLEAVVGALLHAGLEPADVMQAFMALDSHIYGYALQEQAGTLDLTDPAVALQVMEQLGGYPGLVAMARLVVDRGGVAPVSFTFGLDILLDGLERLVAANPPQAGPARRPRRGPIPK